jgi:hypothetical protein
MSVPDVAATPLSPVAWAVLKSFRFLALVCQMASPIPPPGAPFEAIMQHSWE